MVRSPEFSGNQLDLRLGDVIVGITEFKPFPAVPGSDQGSGQHKEKKYCIYPLNHASKYGKILISAK